MNLLVTAVVLAVLLAAAVVALIRLALARRRLERQHAADVKRLSRMLGLAEGEVWHLARERVPAMVAGLWDSQSREVPGLLHPELEGTRFVAAVDAVLATFGEVPEQAARRAEDAARAAVATTSRSMAALVQEVQAAVWAMLERHDDPKVLEDVSRIDHTASQLGRRVQVISVLAGSWPGRQREDSPLLDVVRGAVSRIRDYQRVRVTGEPPVLVSSQAVEAVILALAELLDNAARHSSPSTHVQVAFTTGHNGVTIVIEDAGIGLTPEERTRVAARLSGQAPVLLTQMPNPPRFGIPVAGVLAARYGFRISADQESAYGGVRAVVYLPNDRLVTSTARQAQPSPPPAAPGTPPAEIPQAPVPVPERPDGLPQRRRRARHAAGPVRPQRPVMQPPTGAGETLGAFTRGRRAAQDSPSDSPASLTDEGNTTQ
ncbi:ATP-binding protein [Streptomyces sp. HK10]|uniref:ATP-binding protein n=1 Tax=Streptomyces sp. HK10 TaxID=3373255 RepID=UPI0037486CEE